MCMNVWDECVRVRERENLTRNPGIKHTRMLVQDTEEISETFGGWEREGKWERGRERE